MGWHTVDGEEGASDATRCGRRVHRTQALSLMSSLVRLVPMCVCACVAMFATRLLGVTVQSAYLCKVVVHLHAFAMTSHLLSVCVLQRLRGRERHSERTNTSNEKSPLQCVLHGSEALVYT